MLLVNLLLLLEIAGTVVDALFMDVRKGVESLSDQVELFHQLWFWVHIWMIQFRQFVVAFFDLRLGCSCLQALISEHVPRIS